MKNLRTALVFICLGLTSLVDTVVCAQEHASPKKIPSGTYAIVHHPVSGAVRLVDLSDTYTQDRDMIDPPDAPVSSVVKTFPSGNATLAFDASRDQLVYTDMSAKGVALWRHQLTVPGPEQIGNVQVPAGHLFTKMAAGPDGHIYALTTPLRGAAVNRDQKCKLVRITPGKSGQPACARTIAVLSESGGFHAAMMYSGDMAFSASGDLYIFGTAMDTTIHYYTGSAVFRIPATALRTATGAALRVESLGHIQGMGAVPGYDSTVISGAAFLPDGRFLLSVLDKATQQSAFLFVGRFQSDGIFAERLTDGPGRIPSGFVVADLASRHFPSLPPIRKTQPVTIVHRKPVTQPDDWEQYVTIRTYQY